MLYRMEWFEVAGAGWLMLIASLIVVVKLITSAFHD